MKRYLKPSFLITAFLAVFMLCAVFTKTPVRAEDESLYQTVKIVVENNYTAAFEVLENVNAERKAAGVKELKMDQELLEAAMQRAAELAVLFDHTRPSNESCFTVSDRAHGENIAIGALNSKTVVEAWMGSQGHRENMLDADWKSIGIGAVYSEGNWCWCQLFAGDLETEAKASSYTDGTVYPKIRILDEFLEDGTIPTIFDYFVNTVEMGTEEAEGQEIRVNYFSHYSSCGSVYAKLYYKSLTYSSSDTSVATISSNGVLKAVGPGTVTITLRSKYSSASATDLCWFTFKVVPPNPVITEQPKNKTVSAGGKASFSVAADGKDLSYQWQYRKSADGSWTNISAESGKTETYSLTAQARHDGYQYRCKITNHGGTVYSNIVTLRVKPAITSQPADVTVSVGKTAAFTVMANGNNLSYQWQFRKSSDESWSAISAASGKTAAYSLTAEARHNGYQYRCKVSNAAGTVYSKTVTLHVKPAITAQPADTTVSVGKTAAFTVTAAGKNIKYQWQFRKSTDGAWSAISAASGKTAAYSLTAEARHDGYQYRCKVSNDAGTVYSKIVTLHVKPAVTAQPKDQTVKAGKKVSFTVEAAGNGLTYQWYYRTPGSDSWKAVTAASGQTANYTLTAASRHNGYLYRCKVSNSAGSVYTKAVTLTVE